MSFEFFLDCASISVGTTILVFLCGVLAASLAYAIEIFIEWKNGK